MTSLQTPQTPLFATQRASFESVANAARRSHSDFALSAALFFGLQGEIAFIDAAGEQLLDLGHESWTGTWVSQLEPGLTAADWAERRQSLYEGPRRFQARLARADGPTLEVEIYAALHAVGGRTFVLHLARPAPLVPQLQRELDDLQRRHELIGLAANDGLWVWDLVEGVVDYSPRWAALIGLPEARLTGSIDLWLDRVHPADRAMVDAALASHLDGDTLILNLEHRLEHRQGTWRWVQVRGLAERTADGSLSLMAASTSDITHRKNADERLCYEAFHDSLTGLANRAWLIHRLHDALSASRNQGEHFALVLVGVDGFKLINDSFGLPLGDMLLRAVAARIARSVRSIDTVARVGGDEFVVLLEGLGAPDQVAIVSDRIAREVAEPFDLRGYAVYTSVSMGIVPDSDDYNEPEELLRDANIALVRAKRMGRAKQVVFDSSMREATVKRLMLETDLRRALERAELHLAFQPIIEIATRRLLGFEALCRWNHTKRGIIGPDEFIPLAEESGLIMPIGRWALGRACEEARAWNERPGHQPLWVSVNVSGRQLSQPGFVDEVRQALEDSRLPPALLHLEITESVLMENAEESRALLGQLKGLGIGLSIDDFGTGYSSLAYLRRFPIETLKIDRAFLAGGADTEDSWAIIQMIRALGDTLGLALVVEGVESEGHLARLLALGCEAAQGYVISRPLKEDSVMAFIDGLVGGRV
ncbi:MAG TPA: EAL domain-containing protein, partial [Myxococcota bacterium]|nr:EAL domain-containing protein [Myxococcota bacterium]